MSKMATIDEDYLSKIFPYFDAHMKVMIFESLLESKALEKEVCIKKMAEETAKTRMINYLISLLKQQYNTEEISSSILLRQEKEEKLIEEMHSKFSTLNMVLSDEIFKNYIKIYLTSDDDVIKMAATHFNIPKNFVIFLLEYSCMLYDIGQYVQCSEMLDEYHNIMSTKSDIALEITWGKLACDILTNNFESAVEMIDHLKIAIDSTSMSKFKKINHQAYLLHWSLFIYLRCPSIADRFIDLTVRTPTYKHTLEMVAPHLLRYVVVAYVIIYEEDTEFQILLDIVTQEEYHYSDCFTQFIQALFSQYNIDKALVTLKQCISKFPADFFISHVLEDFEERSYYMIFKKYAKLHKFISPNIITKYFDIQPEVASLLISKYTDWDVDNLDALIPTEPEPPIYHKIFTKTAQLREKVGKREICEID